MNNDNIKIINFNNKKNSIIENDNFNDKSVNEIIFSNDEAENSNNNAENFIMNSNNNSIVIEEDVAIKDEDKIYKDDTVYFQELENQILSTYPVTQQGSKYILDKVKLEVSDIIKAKNFRNYWFNTIF